MFPIEWSDPLRFFIALALGFLVGLERESAVLEDKNRVFAGVRTYTILSLYGFACAWLFRVHSEFALPAGMISIAALLLIGFLFKQRQGYVGWTSEIAALLTFAVGALCLLADVWVAMALGIVNTMLLSEKDKIGHWVERLNKTEFLAVLKFLIVTLIVLPVLPDQDYTRFALNPRSIWQIVALVSSIGFAGYFLTQRYGSRLGLKLSGIIGGVVSSTAVSIAMGRCAQRTPEHAYDAMQSSLLASSVMYIRILVLLLILNPLLAGELSWRLIGLCLAGVFLSFHFHENSSPVGNQKVENLRNPFEIRPALIFAAVFVLLSIASVWVRENLGNAGLMALAFFLGLTDIDPFILSLAKTSGPVEPAICLAILLAMMGNTVAKGLYFGFLGAAVRTATFWRYALWAILHLLLLLTF